MAESPVRVALLARPGTACEQLQAALQQAGAEVVLVADPLGSDAGSVAAAAPRAVLVALEPAVEDVLDRYDPVLLDPAMTVIYEEAELAAKREGWDAARWTRHLAAKLAGHGDVLPPGAGQEAAPAARPTFDAAPIVPAAVDTVTSTPAADELVAFEPVAIESVAIEPQVVEQPAVEQPAVEPATFEPDTAGPADAELATEATSGDAGSGFSGIVPDGELSLDALEFDITPGDVPAVATTPARPAADEDGERPTFDFSALSLEEITETRAPTPQPTPAPSGDPGAVIVLAGIGGPDAVRQFLSALPEGFPRPVLVRQRLDGGRHDRLVRQMQRATSLPVELAEAGATLAPGHVYILPEGMATEVGDERARFVAATEPVPVLAGLPAAGSAILVLSGSDAASVGDVLAAGEAGALVAGQSPEECFDAAAPAALIAGGADGGAPADLAARLAARWPH